MRTPKSWSDVFFDMAFTIAEKSKDDSTQCGAVIVDKDNRILSTGFNGPPSGIDDTLVPWNLRPEKYAYIIHAEENALLFALSSHGGTPLIGSSVYVTHMPCAECTLRMIRQKVACVYVPTCHSPYQMSKYQVHILDILSKQKLSNETLILKRVDYKRKEQT